MKKIYNRKTKQYETDLQYGQKKLQFLYQTYPGRILLKIAVSPFFSNLCGLYNRSRLSRRKIPRFIRQYSIPIADYQGQHFSCFRDFFIRKRGNLQFDANPQRLISPADAKLSIYQISPQLRLTIKNSVYTIEELLGRPYDYKAFENGYCMVFRLSMDDYHRYCYVDDGYLTKQYSIRGELHTVSSISSDYKVFSRNSRVCNHITTAHFGDLLVVEVGALLVGKIHNHKRSRFHKGDEKGFFDLGGSTIILLTQNQILPDLDLLENSKKGIETKVQYGEGIGVTLC